MHKRKVLISLFIASAIAGSCIGASFAALSTNTNSRINMFSANKTEQTANAYIREPMWDSLSSQDKVLYPNETLSKDPRISYETQGLNLLTSKSVPIYVYMDVSIPYRAVRTVSDKTSVSAKTAQSLFTYTINQGWKEIGTAHLNSTQTAMVHTYAYTVGSISEGTQTPPLFTSIHYLNVVEGDVPQGEKLDVAISAKAVQADGPWTGTTAEEKILSAYHAVFNQ